MDFRIETSFFHAGGEALLMALQAVSTFEEVRLMRSGHSHVHYKVTTYHHLLLHVAIVNQ